MHCANGRWASVSFRPIFFLHSYECHTNKPLRKQSAHYAINVKMIWRLFVTVRNKLPFNTLVRPRSETPKWASIWHWMTLYALLPSFFLCSIRVIGWSRCCVRKINILPVAFASFNFIFVFVPAAARRLLCRRHSRERVSCRINRIERIEHVK